MPLTPSSAPRPRLARQFSSTAVWSRPLLAGQGSHQHLRPRLFPTGPHFLPAPSPPFSAESQRLFCFSTISPPVFDHASRHVGSYRPNQGWRLCPLHWKLDVLTTAPPGQSLLS